MKKRDFILSLLCGSFAGCATVQPGNQTVEVRAEQTLSIALSALDSFLAFESKRRGDVPAEVRDIASRIRSRAPMALLSANNLRLAYKNSRTKEKEVSVLGALGIVDALVGEIRVWVPKSVSSGVDGSNVQRLLNESKAHETPSVGSWVVLVPVFVDLAREIYKVVNEARKSAKQDAEWTADEDNAFGVKLQSTITADHWKQI